MSHSRIIQISRNRVNEADRVKASDLNIDMLRSEIECLDYVVDSDDTRENDLNWFKNELKKVGFSISGDEVITGTSTQFLSHWKETGVKASESLNLWKLKTIASGVYFSAFYILDEGYGFPVPLWRWAKDILGTNKKSYIGGIIDYHI